MAVTKSDIVDVELTDGVIHKSFVSRLLGEGDNNADEFGVRLLENGELINTAGVACVGYFVRSDDITLVLTGEVSDGIAKVKLPAAAYAKSGEYTLTIKVSGTGYASTVRMICGSIIDVTTGTVSDPGSVIPSLAELEELVEQAEEYADDINGLSVTATQITGTRYSIAVTKE